VHGFVFHKKLDAGAGPSFTAFSRGGYIKESIRSIITRFLFAYVDTIGSILYLLYRETFSSFILTNIWVKETSHTVIDTS
jgi:hypothetical protein